jgi:hypothetical protein
MIQNQTVRELATNNKGIARAGHLNSVAILESQISSSEIHGMNILPG